ncbi:MAG: gluconokinase [Nocardioides sp.]
MTRDASGSTYFPTDVFVVVMGVSGSGKTTLAEGLGRRLHWPVQEGDELHPAANVEKMSRGEPLNDEDRWPWLDAVGRWLDEQAADGTSAVVTCSALRRVYRDRLRTGRPGVLFCQVTAPDEVLRARMAERRGHYMPASLLRSQLATWEPLEPDEPGFSLTGSGSPENVLDEALHRLGLAA